MNEFDDFPLAGVHQQPAHGLTAAENDPVGSVRHAIPSSGGRLPRDVSEQEVLVRGLSLAQGKKRAIPLSGIRAVDHNRLG